MEQLIDQAALNSLLSLRLTSPSQTLALQNGVGGEEEGEGGSEMMNSSPLLPQSEMEQGEGEREAGMVQ